MDGRELQFILMKGKVCEDGKSSRKKICLRGVQRRIYSDPWRERGTSLLWKKNGDQEIASAF
jgi:hypothetical protein